MSPLEDGAPPLSIPPPTGVSPEDIAEEPFRMRYEDVAQDGRLMLPGMMAGLGTTVWRHLVHGRPIAKVYAHGIVPILRRLVFAGTKGPFSALTPLELTGRLALAHEPSGAGGASRVFVNMWLDAAAPHGTTFGPPPPDDAPREPAGALFAEHVLTRLFAPAGERRVTALDIEGLPRVPGPPHRARSAEEIATAPTDAQRLGATRVMTHTFSMASTDSNQHVNSLAYPRLFEDLALAALRDEGVREPTLLARKIDVCWQRPSFAGDTLEILVDVYRKDDELLATGRMRPAGADRTSVGIAMTFEA